MTEWFRALGYRSHTSRPKKYDEIVLYIKADNPAEALSRYNEYRGVKKHKTPGMIKHINKAELSALERTIERDQNFTPLEKKRLRYYMVDSSVLSSENKNM